MQTTWWIFGICRCATLNAKRPAFLQHYCNNMGFNTRAILNICQLRFHICFQKHMYPQMELWWMSDSCPKTQMCSAALMCRKAGVRLGDTKLIPKETSLWPVLFCGINSSTFESPFKMPPCLGGDPGYKTINMMHLGKISITSHYLLKL